MRRLTVILTALIVATIPTHAGILDRLFGSPARDSSADATASFERGVARLQDHRNRIFHTSEKIDITYDVKKTDSLIQPIVGVVKIVIPADPSDLDKIYDVNLAFRNGSWEITSSTFRLPGISPIHELPNSDRWETIQACFVSDEAIEAVVEATPSPAPPVEATSSQTPRFVTITQSVSVGGDVLPAGTRFQFVSKDASEVHIRYRGGEHAVPISATDLK